MRIDRKFEEIGFIKIREDEHGATYEREVKEYNYKQILEIVHKSSGKHLIQSYQAGVNSDGYNNVVGLSYYETKLVMKKMRKIKFNKIVKQ